MSALLACITSVGTPLPRHLLALKHHVVHWPRNATALKVVRAFTTISPQRAEGSEYKPCPQCYSDASTVPSSLSRSRMQCSSTPKEEKRRKWIDAHNPDTCRGYDQRTLILCFDGTAEQLDESCSNVAHFCSMLKKDDGNRQTVFYQPGVGTFVDPLTSHISMWPKLSLLLDQMFAWNLQHHIKDGYSFLMHNYIAGDKICIFGYSRGAYIARALAAMLHKVGLLFLGNRRQLQSAYDLYVAEDPRSNDLARRLKELYARPVTVEFLGLWDTVASVGLTSRHLPMFDEAGVRYVRHAIALDERRVKYRPHYCYDPSPRPNAEVDAQAVFRRPLSSDVVEKFKVADDKLVNVEEVWFTGSHSDVGGGAIDGNELDAPRLSRIPLRWMIRECFENSTGIIFDACMLQEVGLPVKQKHPDPELEKFYLAPPYHLDTQSVAESVAPQMARPARAPYRSLTSRVWRAIFGPGRAHEEDKPAPKPYVWQHDVPDDWEKSRDEEDALQDIRCPFEANPFWWLFEVVPLSFETTMAEKLKTGDSFALLWNKGKGRRMFRHTKGGPSPSRWDVHRTVQMRLQHDVFYAPKARPESASEPLVKHGRRLYVPAKPLPHHVWNDAQPTAWTWVPAPKTRIDRAATG